MKYGKDGLALTESFEGCRLKAYRDIRGILTIGYGHTGADVHPEMSITLEQAQEFLLADVRTAVDAVNRLVNVQLTQDEFDALVDAVYNIGQGNFEHSTLHKLLNAGNYKAAADEFEKWDKAGGQVVAGLLRRRVAEHELFTKGEQV
jgi:lysozyme